MLKNIIQAIIIIGFFVGVIAVICAAFYMKFVPSSIPTVLPIFSVTIPIGILTFVVLAVLTTFKK